VVTDAAWQLLSTTLTHLFAYSQRGDTLILEHDGRYVQAAHLGFAVHAEAVSTRSLPPDRQWTAGDQCRLVEAGWQPPMPPGYPNFWSEIPTEPLAVGDVSGAARLAALLVVTLRDVLCVATPRQLRVLAWNEYTRRDLRLDLPA
jgi:hypothetical protein